MASILEILLVGFIVFAFGIYAEKVIDTVVGLVLGICAAITTSDQDEVYLLV